MLRVSVILTIFVVGIRGNVVDPFSNRVLREIQFVDGSYGASSKYSYTDKVEDAFKHYVDAFLHTGRDAFGNGDRTFPFPHLIWYNFPSAVLPGRVSFRPRHDKACGDHGYWCGATKWQFIGTNDEVCNENSAWTILCEDLSGKPFERSRQSKYCEVERSVQGAFKCLGISVLDSSYDGPYSGVSISGIRMWKRVANFDTMQLAMYR